MPSNPPAWDLQDGAGSDENRTEGPDGRLCWNGWRYFFVDPFSAELHNVVECEEVVEVVPVTRLP